MFNNSTKFLALIFAFALVFGCITEIPFENNKTFNRISISGQFTDSSENQIVEIREIPNENTLSQANGDPIDNASVRVESQDGQSFIFNSVGKGKYTYFGKGQQGKKYKLFVSEGSRTYESSFHEMLSNNPIDSISAVQNLESFTTPNGSVSVSKNVDLKINANLFAGGHPINVIYRVSSEYEFHEEDIRIAPDLRTCFIKQEFDFGKINVFKGEDEPNNYLSEKVLYSVGHDYKFLYNFSYLVKQYSVDDATYEYWNAVKKVTTKEVSLFDPPPGRFANNIACTSNPDEAPFGFFTVGSVTTKRIFTRSFLLGYKAEFYCTTNGQRRKAECIDCRIIVNSTDVRPAYWIY